MAVVTGWDAPSFCTPMDSQPRLAVLGVLSTHGTANTHLRHAIRFTWAANATAHSGIMSRFIMRGLNTSEEVLREAKLYGDVIFVRAQGELHRNVGPLKSLVLWFQCAAVAWPAAQLIGKADDDVYLHRSGVEAHLRGSLDALRGSSTPMLYWGMMETWRWDAGTHRPASADRFMYKFGGGRGINKCIYRVGWRAVRMSHPYYAPRNLTNANQHTSGASGRRLSRVKPEPTQDPKLIQTIGPIHYAKGPVYFVSTELVRQVVNDPSWRRRVDEVCTHATESVQGVTHSSTRPRPYEDVFTGLSLALAAVGDNLAFVHMGVATFGEPWGTYSGMRNSTLCWHDKVKNADRIFRMHRWASLNHCQPPRVVLNCTLDQPTPFISCTGARWQKCRAVHNSTSCPKTVTRAAVDAFRGMPIIEPKRRRTKVAVTNAAIV